MCQPYTDEEAPGAGEQGSSSEEGAGHPESLSAPAQRQTAAAAWTAGIQGARAQVDLEDFILMTRIGLLIYSQVFKFFILVFLMKILAGFFSRAQWDGGDVTCYCTPIKI